MTEEQAARTGWHEYLLRVKGKQAESRERWELARWMAWQQMLLSPNIKPVHKPKTAQAFCPFPWDAPDDEVRKEKADSCRVSEDEKNELNRIFAEIEKHKNNING